MTSVAKDRTRLRRINPNQNHNKHHTPGIIINYPIFYCMHILYLPFHYTQILILPFCFLHILFFHFIRYFFNAIFSFI